MRDEEQSSWLICLHYPSLPFSWPYLYTKSLCVCLRSCPYFISVCFFFHFQIFIKLFLIAFRSFQSQRVSCVSLRKKSGNNKPSMHHCDHMFLPINYLFFMSHDQIKCFKPCHTNKKPNTFLFPLRLFHGPYHNMILSLWPVFLLAWYFTAAQFL